MEQRYQQLIGCITVFKMDGWNIDHKLLFVIAKRIHTGVECSDKRKSEFMFIGFVCETNGSVFHWVKEVDRLDVIWFLSP